MINHLSLVQNAFSVYKERDNYVASYSSHLVNKKKDTTKIVKSQERKSHQPNQSWVEQHRRTRESKPKPKELKKERQPEGTQITLHYTETTCSFFLDHKNRKK